MIYGVVRGDLLKAVDIKRGKERSNPAQYFCLSRAEAEIQNLP
jgi:hypothetical protein